MKKKNIKFQEDIEIIDIIKIFWNHKILILLITLTLNFSTIAYFYSKTNEFRINIKIEDPPKFFFTPLELYNVSRHIKVDNYKFNQQIINYSNPNLSKLYYENFKANLLSLENIQIFFDNNEDFKFTTNNKNIKEYFQNKLGAEIDYHGNIIRNEYFLIFTKSLNYKDFIEKYFNFTKIQTLTKLLNDQKLFLKHRVDFLNRNLDIAESLIETDLDKYAYNYSEFNYEFLSGSKILKKKIAYLNDQYLRINNKNFNYNLKLTYGIPNQLGRSLKSYIFLSLLASSFISIIAIFFINAFKKSKF